MQGSLLSTSCVVAPPPEHQEPEKTPPRLLLAQAEPPISRIVNLPIATEQSVQEFAVPVQSEDAGDRLVGVLVAWYGEIEEANASSARVIEPANFDDPPRDMRVEWRYSEYEAGLYPLTLVVTHEANFDLETFRPADDFDDVAIITWWVSLEYPTAGVQTSDDGGGLVAGHGWV